MSDKKILDTLSPEKQETYKLTIEGRSRGETAEMMGVPISTITSRLSVMRDLGITSIDKYVTRRNRRFWSKEDDQFLLENIGSMTQSEIGQHLGRSTSSVHQRLKLLDEGLVDENIPWSDLEIRLLAILYEKNLTYNEIADTLSRSSKSIGCKLTKLVSQGVITKRKIGYDVDGFKEKALELKDQGYTNLEIAEETGRTPHAVAIFFSKMRKQGYDIPDGRLSVVA